MRSSWAVNRKYLVSPINGVLNYHRLGNQERNNPEVPFEKASLVLSDVSLTITEVWKCVLFLCGHCLIVFQCSVQWNMLFKNCFLFAGWVEKKVDI